MPESSICTDSITGDLFVFLIFPPLRCFFVEKTSGFFFFFQRLSGLGLLFAESPCILDDSLHISPSESSLAQSSLSLADLNGRCEFVPTFTF